MIGPDQEGVSSCRVLHNGLGGPIMSEQSSDMLLFDKLEMITPPQRPIDLVEEWRPVIGYELLYEVSNIGRVRSLRAGILMKLDIRKRTGYAHVGITKDNVQKRP